MKEITLITLVNVRVNDSTEPALTKAYNDYNAAEDYMKQMIKKFASKLGVCVDDDDIDSYIEDGLWTGSSLIVDDIVEITINEILLV